MTRKSVSFLFTTKQGQIRDLYLSDVTVLLGLDVLGGALNPATMSVVVSRGPRGSVRPCNCQGTSGERPSPNFTFHLALLAVDDYSTFTVCIFISRYKRRLYATI